MGEKKRKESAPKHYGWYSLSQAKVGGTVAYTRPNGEEVVVTCVTLSASEHGTRFTDIECVGEVVHIVLASFIPPSMVKEPQVAQKKQLKPPTREELVAYAKGVVDATSLPIGVRMVVVITDEEGAFVGVASSTSPEDTHGMLACAAKKEDMVVHSG
jgi:hypothetical protein